MEWTDQENKIRDRLTQREITPSPNVWDQLESRLEDRQKTVSNKAWWWGIAASFLVGIAVASFFFMQPKTPLPPALVNESTPAEVSTQELGSEAVEEFAVDPQILEKSSMDLDPGEGSTENNVLKTSSTPNSGLAGADSSEKSTKNTSEPSSFTKEIKTDDQGTQTRSIAAAEQAEDNSEKAHDEWNEAVAGVLEKAREKDRTGVVSDEEIDRLIYEAQLRYKAESALRSSTNTVDANLLLQEVELEMDQSLKDRIFKAIKEQWEKAKTAVASNTR